MHATLLAFLAIPSEFHPRQTPQLAIPVKINSSVSLCAQLTDVIPLLSALPPVRCVYDVKKKLHVFCMTLAVSCDGALR